MANISSALPSSNAQVSPGHQCAHCSKPARQRCAGCAEGVDEHGNTSPTYYCGSECQGNHWNQTHRLQCRLLIDRRQLFQIGSLVQWAFYESNKAFWYDGIAQVKKLELANESDNAELLLQRYKKHDGPDFPTFPKELFQEERDEQAVLATSASASTIVCGLMEGLLRICKAKFSVEEVTIDPRAQRSVRLDPLGKTSSNTSQVCWVFRAKLRDDSMFAIDPCNAQYSFTTSQERNCGVFPWDSYLNRLSVPGIVAVNGLCYHTPNMGYSPVGSIEEGLANLFADVDTRNAAETLASAGCSSETTLKVLQSVSRLSPEKLMHRDSSNAEYAANVEVFKDLLGPSLYKVRAFGLKTCVKVSLRLKAQGS